MRQEVHYPHFMDEKMVPRSQEIAKSKWLSWKLQLNLCGSRPWRASSIFLNFPAQETFCFRASHRPMLLKDHGEHTFSKTPPPRYVHLPLGVRPIARRGGLTLVLPRAALASLGLSFLMHEVEVTILLTTEECMRLKCLVHGTGLAWCQSHITVQCQPLLYVFVQRWVGGAVSQSHLSWGV